MEYIGIAIIGTALALFLGNIGDNNGIGDKTGKAFTNLGCFLSLIPVVLVGMCFLDTNHVGIYLLCGAVLFIIDMALIGSNDNRIVVSEDENEDYTEVSEDTEPYVSAEDLMNEVSAQSKNLVEIIIDENYTLQDTSTSEERLKIGQEIFEELKKTTLLILQLISKSCHQEDFLARLRKVSHTMGKPDDYIYNFKSMLVKDVLSYFDEMGYSRKVSTNTTHGQCLYCILRFISCYDEHEDFTFDNFRINMEGDFLRKYTTDKVKKIMKIYNNVQNNSNIEGHQDFMLITSFAIYNDEITEYMRMLLFRLNQVMVKADGKISSKEKNWLTQILKNQELLEKFYVDEDGSPAPIQGKKEWIAKAEENINAIKRAKTKKAQKNESDKTKQANTPMGELSELIGLEETKKEIASLSNYIQMKQKRDEMGLKSPNVSYHCVFSGNPGTGKTTVARILAGIYRELGVLKEGHLVETDRSGLVAEYVGQTAVKTNKIIDEALDGVLFIDEAYSLVQGGKEDYGKEAIATLLKRMEDDRDRLVVILAGYTNEIEEFINSNPGLRSRFNRYIHFPDYSAKELYDIFCFQMKKNEYTISADASEYLKMHFVNVTLNKPRDFGNARYVRNLFERAIEKQADRLADDSDLTKEKLAELRIEDFK